MITQIENLSVKYLTFEKNTRKHHKDKVGLFRAVSMGWHENERLGVDTSKIFNIIWEKLVRLTLETFESSLWKKSPQWRSFLKEIISCTL